MRPDKINIFYFFFNKKNFQKQIGFELTRSKKREKKMLALDSTGESGSTDPVNLSMIDCGIKSLKNIPLQLSTVSINLHSNCIQRIENLHFLQSLVHLDLSSNQIKRIDGLQGLVSLQSLNLSCNSIVSIENLDGLRALK